MKIINNSGIYQILNLANDKFYVGSSINFNKREYLHRWFLNRNEHSNKYLQSAWNKYWEQSFEFIIIECCEKEQLIEREQYWIDLLKPEYNLLPTAGSRLGTVQTEEHKNKIANSNRGKKRSLEARERISKGNLGKVMSKEARLKISLAKIGTTRKFSESHKKNIAIGKIGNKHWVGKTHSEESKLKMSSARKNWHLQNNKPRNRDSGGKFI